MAGELTGLTLLQQKQAGTLTMPSVDVSGTVNKVASVREDEQAPTEEYEYSKRHVSIFKDKDYDGEYDYSEENKYRRDGSIKSSKIDLDYDGEYDYIEKNRLFFGTSVEVDSADDGSADYYESYYSNGVVRNTKIDSDNNGETDYSESYYKDGSVSQIGIDSDGDGTLDYTESYYEDGSVSSTTTYNTDSDNPELVSTTDEYKKNGKYKGTTKELDKDQDGEVDHYIIYNKNGKRKYGAEIFANTFMLVGRGISKVCDLLFSGSDEY